MLRVVNALGLALTFSLLSACGSSDDAAIGSRGGTGNAGSGAMTAGSGGSATMNGGSSGMASSAGTNAGGTSAAGTGNAGAANGGSAGNSVAGSGGASGSGSSGASNGGSANGGSSGTSGAAGSTSSSDIVGKVTVGYQGWFTAAGDGSGINPPWWHWTADRNTPTTSNIAIKSWPVVSEFSKTYATGFANLNGGGAATLYSAWDASTVDTQIKWMQDTGIDTIALQRFGDFRDTGEARNVAAANVRAAAEAHGRKFYIMYDISGWDTFDTDLKSDWTDHIIGELHLLDSAAYAKQDGKPVVCIWGLGYLDHPGTPQTTQDIIDYFHQQGLYVIGGLGNDWRTATGTRWSQAGFSAVFDTLDAISPWMVGVIGNNADSDNNRTTYNQGDVTYLHGKGKHYQPCVLPGDLSGHQRHHGDFMWHQFYNMIQIGSDGIYISMYDEYNEGNQIAKTAATSASIPAGSNFVTLDEDGTACSSDYYLRLTADGGKMLRKQIALTDTRPTSPM
ncbi:MAG TPA: glycoside hydrolase family 71/99-like protein [Polyangiaceae bacterium]|jgi:hypothetical protein|nr:glycoside hydrolase family 71/99-like protein [Polyangiaceae bacterium]